MKKLIAVLLTAAMLFSLVVMIGAETSLVKAYADAEAGELLYTANFNGDSSFTPGANLDFNADIWTITPSADGKSVDIVGDTETTTPTDNMWWGGFIPELKTGADTHYTVVFKVKNNAPDNGTDNSIGISFYKVNEAGTTVNYSYGIYGDFYTRAKSTYATGGGTYKAIAELDPCDVDEDGFMTVAVDFNGTEQTSYFLADNAEATLDADMTNWVEFATRNDLDVAKAQYMQFGLYLYRPWATNMTVKNVEFYKGAEEAEEPAPSGTDIPAVLEENGAEHIKLTTPVATAPVQDGVIGDGEYSASNTINADNFADYQSAAFQLGAEDSIVEYFAYDADYFYYAVDVNVNGYQGKEFYFCIDGMNGLMADAGKTNLLGLGHSEATGAPFAWYGHTGSASGVFTLPPSVKARLEADFSGITYTGADYLFNDNANQVSKDALAALMNLGHNAEKTVFEIKMARKYVASSDGIYSFKTMINPVGGAPNRMHLNHKLTDEQKAALGTESNWAPRFVVLDYVVTYDIPAVLEENGISHNYLGTEAITTAPTLDGSIGEDEYQFSTTLSKDDASVEAKGDLAYDLEEYIAYDDNYIYYAVKGPIADNTYVDLRIKPAEVVAADGVTTEIAQGSDMAWVQLKLVNGVGQEWRYRLPSPLTFLTFADGDITFAVQKVENDFIIELKVGRAPMNVEYGLENDDITAYAYYLSLNGTTYIGNKLNETLAAALGIELGTNTAPRYAVLSDAPEAPDDPSDPSDPSDPAITTAAPTTATPTTATPTTAAPTTAAPTTVAPTTVAPTTVAPTTAAPTTAAPTTAAPAEDDGGCGGSISLAAMAMLPVLVCGVALVGKKKED